MARKPRDFGERVTVIEARLKRRGFDAEDIAAIFEVSQQTIRKWKKRRRPPSSKAEDSLVQAEMFLDMISRVDIPDRFGDQTFTQISDSDVGLIDRPIFAFDVPSEISSQDRLLEAIRSGSVSSLDFTVNIIDPVSLESENETFRMEVDEDTDPSEIVSEFFDLFRRVYEDNRGASFALSSVLPA